MVAVVAAEITDEEWARRYQAELARIRKAEPSLAIEPTAPPKAVAAVKRFQDTQAAGQSNRAMARVSENVPALQDIAGAASPFPAEQLQFWQRAAKSQGGSLSQDSEGHLYLERPGKAPQKIGQSVWAKIPGLLELGGSLVGASNPVGAVTAPMAASALRQSIGHDIATGDTEAMKGRLAGAAVGGAVPFVGPVIGQEIGGAIARKPGDEVDPLERATQIGVAGAAGGLGYGLGKLAHGVAGMVASRVSPEARAAALLAAEGPSAPSLFGGTTDSALERGRQMLKAARELQPNVTLKASQLLGSKGIAAIEKVVSQTPGNVDRAAIDAANQATAFGGLLDATVRRAAANPELLGEAEVGQKLVRSASGYVQKMQESLSEIEGPLYARAHEASRGARVIQGSRFLQEAGPLLDEWRADPKALGRLPEIIDNAKQLASGTGRLMLQDYHTIRKAIGRIASGEVTVSDSMKASAQRRIAARLFGALEADLEASAKGIASGEAASSLAQALKVGREGRAAIDLAREKLSSLLDADISTEPEKAVDNLLKMSQGGARNLLGALDQIDPDGAADLRAIALRRIFEKGGYGRELPYASETPVRGGSPTALRKAMADQSDLIRAMYPEGSKTAARLQNIQNLAGRMELNAGTAGSDTHQNALHSLALGVLQRASTGSTGVLGAAQQAVAKRAYDFLGQPEQLNRVLGTPEGMDVFLRAAEAAYHPGPLNRAARKTIQASLQTLVNLGSLASRPEIQIQYTEPTQAQDGNQ